MFKRSLFYICMTGLIVALAIPFVSDVSPQVHDISIWAAAVFVSLSILVFIFMVRDENKKLRGEEEHR